MGPLRQSGETESQCQGQPSGGRVRTGLVRRWEIASEGSSSEDSLAGEQEDRDEDEEGDRHGDARGNAKRWEDINQNPKGEPAEEAAPHFPGTSEDDDHEADGSVGRADEWGNPDREPDGEEGAAGHGQAKSNRGGNRRDSSRGDPHELRSPDVLAVRANRIS